MMESAKKLNFFPPKGGVSKHYSPRVILHHEELDYNKHCKYTFGEYVQACQDEIPKNKNQPRTLDCIYLRPNAHSQQGGHELLHIPTGKIITRSKISAIPMTQAVIDAVHKLADLDGAPKGLKIVGRNQTILWDSAWSAGVDYDPTTFEPIEDNQEDDDEDLPEVTDDEDEYYSSDEESYDEEFDEDQYEDLPPVTAPRYRSSSPGIEESKEPDEDPFEEQATTEDTATAEENVNDNDNENDDANDTYGDAVLAEGPNESNHDDDNGRNVEDELAEGIADQILEEIQEESTAHESREVRGLRDGLSDIQPENMGRTRQQTSSMQSHHQKRQVRFEQDIIAEEKPMPIKNESVRHLHHQGCFVQEYSSRSAQVFVQYLEALSHLKLRPREKKKLYSFIQTYGLRKGIEKFGKEGKKASIREAKQLHDRGVFYPIDVSELTQEEIDEAMDSLMFLVQKRDGTIKGRTCADGSIQKASATPGESASPTCKTESVMITATVDAHEKRDVMTSDVPNAFVQTSVPPENKVVGKRIVMKIRGLIVDLLLEVSRQTYEPYVTHDNKGRKILYVVMDMALYGMIQSSLLYYNKFVKDIKKIGFVLNPYDPCVANRMVNGKQHTLTWHVDDIKSSHVDPKVNDQFHAWLQKQYGDVVKVKSTRGKIHPYLGMKLDYTLGGKAQVDMTDYVRDVYEDFEKADGEPLKEAAYPWDANLFKVDEKSPALPRGRAEQFVTFVYKCLFVSQRARQDISPGVAFFTTRVKAPAKEDWAKLKKMMRFLKRTKDDVLCLEADNMRSFKWHLDAAFAVHNDYKSHTGATMTMGKGVIQSVSTKQKINTRSSTEAELVSFDDIMSRCMWTKLFYEAQGYKLEENLVYRDNQSAMKLELNGKASSGKRTRHFNIKYFFITDLISRGEVQTKYCPTDCMIADYMTKPLTGNKFKEFRKVIMNLQKKEK